MKRLLVSFISVREGSIILINCKKSLLKKLARCNHFNVERISKLWTVNYCWGYKEIFVNVIYPVAY